MTIEFVHGTSSDTLRQEFQPWQSALVTWVRSRNPDLSNRQMAVLLLVTLEPGPHTVRGLAAHLNITKPAISRALNRLGELRYASRIPDKRDGRNVFIIPTELGRSFLNSFAESLTV